MITRLYHTKINFSCVYLTTLSMNTCLLFATLWSFHDHSVILVMQRNISIRVTICIWIHNTCNESHVYYILSIFKRIYRIIVSRNIYKNCYVILLRIIYQLTQFNYYSNYTIKIYSLVHTLFSRFQENAYRF